jgi:exopolyphosphatase/guanosine-5'-triphosphate,3'-diphosphate pyrophosphatase
MNYGIIDMGSNTIRLCIYHYEDGTLNRIMDRKEMAELASYIKDGKLSQTGINVACNVLQSFSAIVSNFSLDGLYVFATASLRNISNTDMVVQIIREQTGFQVEVLSGEEEARLDFIGIFHETDVNDGVMADIGGGSTEIVIYENSKIVNAACMPIGSLNLYSQYVKRLIPSAEEREKITARIEEEFSKLKDFPSRKIPVLCGVGGTSRAALKLNNRLFDEPAANREMDAGHIRKILKRISKDEIAMAKTIVKIVPERIHTITTGLLILNAVVGHFGSEQVYVSGHGVREGYIYGKVLNEHDGANQF